MIFVSTNNGTKKSSSIDTKHYAKKIHYLLISKFFLLSRMSQQKKSPKEGEQGESIEGITDEGSQTAEVRITVVESSSGKVLTGDEAPLASQVSTWLELHPGWTVVPREDEEEDGSDEEEGSDDEEEEAGKFAVFMSLQCVCTLPY